MLYVLFLSHVYILLYYYYIIHFGQMKSSFWKWKTTYVVTTILLNKSIIIKFHANKGNSNHMHSVVTSHMLPDLPGIIFPLRLRHWHLLAVTLPEALFNPGVWRCHHLPSRCTWCNPWGLRSSGRSPSPRAARWSLRAADAQTPALAGRTRKHTMTFGVD